MAKKEADILLIRKYLNGELDARAMHRLEARAQDDPFLMDALEGYEKAGRNQQPALGELSSRLRQRVEQKEVRRIIPFRFLAIAASVLVVFTVGWLLLVKTKKEKSPQIAQVIKPENKTQPAAPAADDTGAARQLAKQKLPVIEKRAVLKPAGAPAGFAPVSGDELVLKEVAVTKPSAKSTVQNEPVAAAPVIQADKSVLADVIIDKPGAAADTTPLNELVVMNYNADKKKALIKTPEPASQRGYLDVPPSQAAPLERKLVSKAQGVSNTPAVSPLAGAASQRLFVQGRIIDEIDRRPLPGVSVRATGTSYGAVTDRNGQFYVPSDSLKQGLVVSRMGYNTAKISAAKGDPINTITLAPNDFPLKEPAIASSVKNAAGAHPQIGWSKYNSYLEKAAVSPDRKTGSVELSFSVDKNGSISGTAIITGLSDAADKKAIELVNKGPKWVGNANGKAEQVMLTINF